MEKLVTDSRLAQLHDEVINRLNPILDLAGVVAGDFVRLHLLPVRLAELGGELLVLFFRNQVFAELVLRIQMDLLLLHAIWLG